MDETDPEGRIIPLAEVRSMLAQDEKERELSYDKRVALEHAKMFSPLPPAKTKELVSKVSKLERVSVAHGAKIAEILPRDVDELRPVFAKDRFTLEQEEIDTILEAVLKYI
jgi:DNA-directed RNA polymerase subunit F